MQRVKNPINQTTLRTSSYQNPKSNNKNNLLELQKNKTKQKNTFSFHHSASNQPNFFNPKSKQPNQKNTYKYVNTNPQKSHKQPINSKTNT